MVCDKGWSTGIRKGQKAKQRTGPLPGSRSIHCRSKPPSSTAKTTSRASWLVFTQPQLLPPSGLHTAARMNFSIKHKSDDRSYCLRALRKLPISFRRETKATPSLLLSKYHPGSWNTLPFRPSPPGTQQLSSSQPPDPSSEIFPPGSPVSDHSPQHNNIKSVLLPLKPPQPTSLAPRTLPVTWWRFRIC